MWRISVDSLPPTLNSWLRGTHWRTKNAQKHEWDGILFAALVEAKIPKKLPTPLIINVTQFCASHLRDADNAVVAAKFLMDTLVTHAYIPDDSPEFVSSVILQTKKSTDKINRLVILISNATV